MHRSTHTDKSDYTVMCQKEEKDPSESQELPVNNEQHEILFEATQPKQQLMSQSSWLPSFLSSRRKKFFTGVLLLFIVGGIMVVSISFNTSRNKDSSIDNNQKVFIDQYSDNDLTVDTDDKQNNESDPSMSVNNIDNTNDRVPRLRSGSAYSKPMSPEKLGNMNIYIRKPNQDGQRGRYKKHRFPVARYKRERFPFTSPLISFAPWLPIFVDRLTRQTFIFSPAGGVYIIPPVINSYGKMYSVAELIKFGYASLVSSGAPLAGPINMLPYFQPTPLYGPGIPILSPATGGFVGGLQTNYESFNIPKQPRTYVEVDSIYESEEDNNYQPSSYDQDKSYKPSDNLYYRQSDSTCKLTFGLPTKHAHGFDAEDVYVADFNKDNNKDIAVLYFLEGVTRILLGRGDGTFETPIKIENGFKSEPSAIVAGDFNHDDKLDIIITLYGKSHVVVYFGQGNGHFKEAHTYFTGTDSYPSGVALGDFNNDKKLDFIVACQLASKLEMYFGKDDGSFEYHHTYLTDLNSGPVTPVVGDFNKDGNQDFIVSLFKNDRISVYLGDGKGNFVERATYSTGKGPYIMIVQDFNYDGILDAATSNYDEDTTSVFHGKGDGTFVLQQTLFTGIDSKPFSVDVGDFNNDKIIDLVVANSEKDNAGVFLGTGTGTFERVKTYSTGEHTSPYTVAVGDFNNDGLPDLVSANQKAGDVSVLLNKCS